MNILYEALFNKIFPSGHPTQTYPLESKEYGVINSKLISTEIIQEGR